MLEATFTERGPTPRHQARAANDIARRVGWQVGAHWHRTFLPLRFTHAKATELGYQARTAAYNRIKFRKYGHTYPLVFTGATKAAILSHIVPPINVTATGGKARIRVSLPGSKGLNRRRTASAPNMAREIRRVSQSEADALSVVAAEWFQRHTQQISTVTVHQTQ